MDGTGGSWRAWGALVSGLARDARASGPLVAGRRALRATRLVVAPGALRALERSPTARAHRRLLGLDDPLFPLTHRHYLARGLPARARLAAALCHYGHEDVAFGEGYGRAVAGEGLRLWGVRLAGVEYGLVLGLGQDVLHEGGLTVALTVDGGRVAVASFSLLPAALLRPGEGGTIPFLARKQMAADRAYQGAFHKAFDRATPAHLCLAAVAGWAGALGHGRGAGIAAARHPSWTPGLAGQFARAYDDFWESLRPTERTPLGPVFELPPRLTPLDALDARRRARALARRAHLEEVAGAARAAVAACRLAPGGGPG